VPQSEPKPLTINERLAAAGDRDEVMQILGRRRLLRYTLGFLAVAMACGGYGVYLIFEVALGRTTVWTLAALPACIAAAAFFGVVGYGMAYAVATGRRPPNAGRIGRFFARLNSNL
jgi:hypothetical protein